MMESHTVLTWMLLCLLLRPLAAQNQAPEAGKLQGGEHGHCSFSGIQI